MNTPNQPMNKDQIAQTPYFATLPKHVQESVMQSAAHIQTEDDLRRMGEHLMMQSFTYFLQNPPQGHC